MNFHRPPTVTVVLTLTMRLLKFLCGHATSKKAGMNGKNVTKGTAPQQIDDANDLKEDKIVFIEISSDQNEANQRKKMKPMSRIILSK